jgi:hypothetical protein
MSSDFMGSRGAALTICSRIFIKQGGYHTAMLFFYRRGALAQKKFRRASPVSKAEMEVSKS